MGLGDVMLSALQFHICDCAFCVDVISRGIHVNISC